MSHAKGWQPKDAIGLGYGVEDDLLEFTRDAPMTSDSKFDTNETPITIVAYIGDYIPSTSLIWGEEFTPDNDVFEASTSRGNEQNEFNIRE